MTAIDALGARRPEAKALGTSLRRTKSVGLAMPALALKSCAMAATGTPGHRIKVRLASRLPATRRPNQWPAIRRTAAAMSGEAQRESRPIPARTKVMAMAAERRVAVRG